ncbi:hypothetical protein TrLO_g5490 [Triparma laevis f. longispina]|uniref:C2H2-type domain-containing protein n=1 Tax=Triparma laevis f. longispina TaxID=1714387 RepID=A0A9W7KU37_9STRA|nr:hypothetical protein TrLO_g5490 [Triparma laevis f. longispina]
MISRSGKKRIEGVERNKWGQIDNKDVWDRRCKYMNGNSYYMKVHKAAKHGINVVWFSCDQDNCDYKAKQAGSVKQHKRDIHNIDVVWHQCNSCDYRAKQASSVKLQKRNVHDIGVGWHQCDSSGYKSKQASNLKRHKKMCTKTKNHTTQL